MEKMTREEEERFGVISDGGVPRLVSGLFVGGTLSYLLYYSGSRINESLANPYPPEGGQPQPQEEVQN